MYLIYMMITVMLVIILNLIFFFLSMKGEKDDNMISPYECGFDPIIGSRVEFSYRFFLISILFLVFDVEISLLLPLPFLDLGEGLGWGVILFMMILLGGLIYEYYNGVLVWLD